MKHSERLKFYANNSEIDFHFYVSCDQVELTFN